MAHNLHSGLLVLSCLSAVCVQDTTGPDRASKAPPSRVALTEHFAFHSSRWLNLHHCLFQWARGEGERDPNDRRRVVKVAEKAGFEVWPEADQRVWRLAVGHYREHWIDQQLTFHPRLTKIKRRLIALDRDDAADPRSIDEPPGTGLGAVLASAMPVYERRMWADHDAGNRERIADFVSGLRKVEKNAARGLARAYGEAWSKEPVRVDVAPYTNWAGAYTTNDPDHIMVSSADLSFAGWGGVEILVHEVAHTTGFERSHRSALSAAFARQGSKESDRLWHALIFYTAGELMRIELARLEVSGFQSYEDRRGFYARSSWAGFKQAFDRHWRPFLRGEIERAKALDGIAAELGDRER